MTEALILRESDHTYWLGKRQFPSVSEVIRPVCNFDGIPVEVLERKSEIGRAVHSLTEWHDRREAIDKKTIHPEVLPYFEAWRKFTKEMKPKWSEIEVRKHHPVMGYAGTKDRRGVITALGPETWIVDVKTVATVSKATGLQTAAYAGLDSGNLVPLTRRAAVQLKKDGTYRFEEFSDPADWPTFVSLLTLWKWKFKHGLLEKS